MKKFKNINVFLDGSSFFCYNIETTLTKNFVSFQKHNSSKSYVSNTKTLNPKVIKFQYLYKKKYLKF